MTRYNVIDLFCGAGGFSKGFYDLGFNIVLGLDNFEPVARTFKFNFSNSIVICEDIRNVYSDEILTYLKGKVPHIIIGSPPCEPFTAANPNRKESPLDRLYVDLQGQLTLEFIRIVKQLKPEIFIMENVPQIMENGLKKALIREFKDAGYNRVFFNILRAEDYGTPSHRIRVFISNIPIKPKKKHKRITVEEALKDLPPPGTSGVMNHELPPLSKKKLRRIRKLKWGQALIRYYGFKGKQLPNLIRLHPKKIAPTVLGSSRFIHPYEDRFLTVREQARLMGYPDNFVFLGGRDVQYNQVGESVPVPLSRSIAEVVLEYLTSRN